jgi:hypothetical protein
MGRPQWEDFVSGFLLVGLTLFSATSDSLREAQNQILLFLYENRVWIYASLAFAVVAFRFIGMLRARPKRERIRAFLECLHEHYFSSGPGQLDPRFRVTLFTPQRSWVGRRVLKVYARSTRVHPTSKVRWSIPRSCRGKFDGIAGAAFATGTEIEMDDLPGYHSAAEEEKALYRNATYLDETKVRKLNRLSRAFRALAVKDLKGRHVAVLMIESEEPSGLRDRFAGGSLYWEARHLQALFA